MSSAGFIKVGGITSVDDEGTSAKGFFTDADGDVLIKAAQSNFIKFKSNVLQIKSTNEI